MYWENLQSVVHDNKRKIIVLKRFKGLVNSYHSSKVNLSVHKFYSQLWILLQIYLIASTSLSVSNSLCNVVKLFRATFTYGSLCHLENSAFLLFFPFPMYRFLWLRKHFNSPKFLSQGGVACEQSLIFGDMSKAVGEQRELVHWWHQSTIGKLSEPVRIFSCQAFHQLASLAGSSLATLLLLQCIRTSLQARGGGSLLCRGLNVCYINRWILPT